MSWIQDAAKEGLEPDIIPQESTEEQMIRYNQARAKDQLNAHNTDKHKKKV